MADVVDVQSRLNARLTVTEKEAEVLKWEPLACALYEMVNCLKEEFGADDEVMVRALRVLVEGFEKDLEYENDANDGDGDDDAA